MHTGIVTFAFKCVHNNTPDLNRSKLPLAGQQCLQLSRVNNTCSFTHFISLHRTFDSANVFRNADTVGTIKEHTVWILDSVTGKVKGFWGRDM